MLRRCLYTLVFIDPFHAAAILDLKEGWTGIKNALNLKMACALFIPVQPRFESKIAAG